MKRALIVDDSRLARHVLSQLLTEHGVDADTAESAEAALEYLKGHRPDVIFLDHLMPGMDGFQALEAIKTNPVTATIPVMMYTSKEGEVYLGQARALGALGVLPKDVEPVEVAKVLRSLHLIPSDEQRAHGGPPTPQPLDARQLRQLLGELFYEQNSMLREELRRELHSAGTATTASLPMLEAPPSDAAPSRVYKVASALLLVTAALFAYLYFSTQSMLAEANERSRSLASTATELSTAVGRALAPTRSSPAADAGTFEVLEWGVNQGGQFGFDEVPLNDARADVLTMLTAELDRLGFEGTVALDVHVGRYCMTFGADGALVLAAPTLPVTMCEELGWTEPEAVSLGQRESVAFAYALADIEALYPGIRIETVSRGTPSPVAPYPTSYEATAGEWNAVAARNQRVEIRLMPGEATSR